MNPKPKFRAWYKPDFEKKTGPLKFIQGVKDGEELVFFCEKCKFINYPYSIPFQDDDWVVEQFTGLKDKNGVEIYDGDIYEVAMNKKYVIKFSNGSESNHEWHGGVFVLYLNEEVFFPFDEYAMRNGSVIGNIHETPDLIK
jgi:uncharacterized phage protein (TIGR01671 family)